MGSTCRGIQSLTALPSLRRRQCRRVAAGGEFDPVVSGVAMPATDGPTMIREVHELRTAMPVVFTTGYAEEQLRDESGLPTCTSCPSRSRWRRSATRWGWCWLGWDNRLELGQY